MFQATELPALEGFFGCRFSLYPMTDSFVDVILDSVRHIGGTNDIEVITDDVSTCLKGRERPVFEALTDCLAMAADTGHHVVLTATFSKG